jgi:tetratricopeptide (TPR) repeat protein
MNAPLHTTVYTSLGQVAEAEGDYERAQQHYEASLAYCEQVKNELWSATPLAYLGNLARIKGDHAESVRLLQRSLEINQKYIQVGQAAHDHLLLGVAARERADADAAQEEYQGSFVLFEADENREGMALALNGLGEVAARRNQPDKARVHLTRALRLAGGVGAVPLILQILVNWADYYLSVGDAESAFFLAAFVTRQAAATHETRRRASVLAAREKGALSPTFVQEGEQQAGDASLEEVLARCLGAEGLPVSGATQPVA